MGGCELRGRRWRGVAVAVAVALALLGQGAGDGRAWGAGPAAGAAADAGGGWERWMAVAADAARAEPERRAALRQVGRLGPAAAGAVPGLVSLLGEQRNSVGFDAQQALAQIGGPAVGPVTEALADPARQRAALYVLGQLGPAASKSAANVAQVGRTAADLRDRVAALAEMGAEPKLTSDVAAAVLAAARAADDSYLPGHLAEAVGRMGLDAVPLVTSVLGGTDEAAKAAFLAYAIPRLGPDAAPAARAVAARLADRSSKVRGAAGRALAAIGPGATEAAPALIEAWRAEVDADARRELTRAMGAVRDERVAAALLAALGAGGPDDRSSICRAWGGRGRRRWRPCRRWRSSRR